MMHWILGSSVKLRLVVAALAMLLMVFAFTELRNVPGDALPEFSRPHLVEALCPQEMVLITPPMETDMLNGVPWARGIRTVSIPGLASLVLVFQKGDRPQTCSTLVQEFGRP